MEIARAFDYGEVEPARRRADVPLAHAAATLGFADQAHFTRIFGAIVGMTPGAFRRLMRSQ